MRIELEKILPDALNPIIANIRMKDNLRIKGKIIFKKETIAKEGEITELKKGSKWKIVTKAIYINNLVLSLDYSYF